MVCSGWWFLLFYEANLHHPKALPCSVNTPRERGYALVLLTDVYDKPPLCTWWDLSQTFTLFSLTSNSLFCFNNKGWQPHKSYICRGKAKDTNNMHRLRSLASSHLSGREHWSHHNYGTCPRHASQRECVCVCVQHFPCTPLTTGESH